MNPLMSAEQAVLGAVLLDPEQLTHLEWLAADHFYRPVHQALFDPLRKLRNDGHPALSADGPLPLSWVTDAVEEAGQHVRRLTAAYAHTLIQACPRTEHAPVYGRMVLEGAIHRTVAQHAIRPHQAARANAVQGGGLAAAGRLRRPDPRAALPVPGRAVPPGRTHRPEHPTLEGPATQSVSRRHSAERAADRRLRRHHPRRRRLLRHQVMRSSLTCTTAASAQAIRTLAQHAALGPGPLINHARTRSLYWTRACPPQPSQLATSSSDRDRRRRAPCRELQAAPAQELMPSPR